MLKLHDKLCTLSTLFSVLSQLSDFGHIMSRIRYVSTLTEAITRSTRKFITFIVLMYLNNYPQEYVETSLTRIFGHASESPSFCSYMVELDGEAARAGLKKIGLIVPNWARD